MVVVSVPKLAQRFSWDCGIACLSMLLRALAIPSSFNFITRLIATDSVWTVDLAQVLSHLSVPFSLYTTHIGVQPSYAFMGFYRSNFYKDKERVEDLFSLLGSHVHRQYLSSVDIAKSLLFHGKCAIVLVDSNLLHCLVCTSTMSVLCMKLSSFTTGYSGHFILLCGASHDLFFYKDPARECNTCMCTWEDLERARVDGTDGDCLMIDMDLRDLVGASAGSDGRR